MVKFSDYFNEKSLFDFFKRYMRSKGGGGKDRLSARMYERRLLNADLEKIISKVCDGTYHFSSYNEKLLLKGANKLPRVISVPTIRDRWVLGMLQQYISDTLGGKFRIATPNENIRIVKQYIDKNREKSINYCKIDFSDFYGSIDQSLLFSQLVKFIPDRFALDLIFSAIQTPTSALGTNPQSCRSLKGIPQGLAISNILAMVYMSELDCRLKKRYGDGYIRYVDDILILTTDMDDAASIIEKEISRLALSLTFNQSKVRKGVLTKDSMVEFLGYQLSKEHIGIRRSTRMNFERKIVRLCTDIKRLFEAPALLPKYVSKESLPSYASVLLSMTITGFVADGRVYGWIPYFREIDDLSILFALDNLIRKVLGNLSDKIKVPSFVKAYYSANTHDKRFLFNFDRLENREEKIVYLQRRCMLDETKTYTDEEINELLAREKEFWKRSTYVDVGSISD